MTTNRELYLLARSVFHDSTRLVQLLYEGVLQRISEAEGGLSASTLEALGSSGAPSNPTAVLALRSTGLAETHRRELDTALQAAHAHVQLALVVADLYPPPREADATDRAALARLNGQTERGCESCARLRAPSGEPRWEPVDSRRAEASTVGGRLSEPWLLCRWCADRVVMWNRVPTLDELARHHRGERVPWPDDVPRPA